MQKKLIALAVASLAAGSVYAQSSVTIGGWMTIGVKNYKGSDLNTAARGTAQVFKNEFRVDDDSNSRFWFTGKEDLGGGMDAHFYIESRFGADNGPSATTFGLAAGDTFVGITAPYGTFDFGRVTTYYTQGVLIELDKSLSGNNQLSLTELSTMGTMVFNNFSRNSNNIRYITPRVAGFQGKIVYSPNFAPDEGKIPTPGAAVNNSYSKGDAWTLSADYMNGPIYLNAAYWKANIEGRPGQLAPVANMLLADQESYRLSGSYTLPFGLKIGASYDHGSVKNVLAGTRMPTVFATIPNTDAAAGGHVLNNGKVSRNAWFIPVSYAFGNNTVFAKYGQAGNIKNWSRTDTGARFLVLGYDHALSKRTAIGVSYAVTDNDSNGTYQPFAAGSTHTGSQLVAGEKATVLQANLTHRF